VRLRLRGGRESPHSAKVGLRREWHDGWPDRRLRRRALDRWAQALAAPLRFALAQSGRFARLSMRGMWKDGPRWAR
jgi:hypothetical protein